MNKIRLLIVEDNEELRRELVDYFQDQPEIIIAGESSNGIEALHAVKESQVDVMLLDMIMPVLDGFGVLESLNELNLANYPRVIMTSAVGQDAIIQKAMSLGAEA